MSAPDFLQSSHTVDYAPDTPAEQVIASAAPSTVAAGHGIDLIWSDQESSSFD